MKRLIALLLVCCLLVAGCGSPAPVPENAQPLIRVGFSQVGSESDWRLANTKSMIDALSEAKGFDLLFDNAMQKQENQLLAIRNFIQQEVDYIVVAPISEYGWDNVLQEAKDAGIPVIIVDRQIQVADESLYTCWIGSDFYAEGQTAVSWLTKKLKLQHRADEEIDILHIQGTDDSTAQLMRTKALEDGVAENKHWQIIDNLRGDFTEAKSYEVVRDFLETGHEIDVIYCENDNMTFGAIRALEEAGITCGSQNGVIIISFDAVHTALEYCMCGKINLCVECNPLHGERVADIIRALEEGRELPKKNYVDETSFSSVNLTPELIKSRRY